MYPQIDNMDSTPQLRRLIEQVERLELHAHEVAMSPREWLVRWLATPQDALDGRKPAWFLAHEDFDLILVGLLMMARTERAWTRQAAAATPCEASRNLS